MTVKFNYKLFGLEARDLRVYETLLERSQVSSIRAVAEAVGINYGTTYEIIKKLVKYGLVTTQIKEKRHYYAAEKPEKLRTFAREQHMAIGQEIT